MPAMPEQTLTNVNAPDVLVQPGMWMIGVDGVMGGPDRRVWQVLGDLGGVSADGDAFEAGVRARRAPGPSRSLSGGRPITRSSPRGTWASPRSDV